MEGYMGPLKWLFSLCEHGGLGATRKSLAEWGRRAPMIFKNLTMSAPLTPKTPALTAFLNVLETFERRRDTWQRGGREGVSTGREPHWARRPPLCQA